MPTTSPVAHTARVPTGQPQSRCYCYSPPLLQLLHWPAFPGDLSCCSASTRQRSSLHSSADNTPTTAHCQSRETVTGDGQRLVHWITSIKSLHSNTYHGKVPLPRRSTRAIAQGAGPLHAVATALTAVQRDMVLGPGHAAGEARAQLHPQFLNRHDVIHGDLQWTAHQIGQGRRDTVSSVVGERE